MLFNPLVLVLAPEHIDATPMHGVCASGFDCRVFSRPQALYAEVRGMTDVQGIAAVLMGTSAENRNAVFYLRTIQAELGLIAQLRTDSEEEQMGLIQAGVDWTCPVGASCDLIATMLLSLWDRRMSSSQVLPEAAPRRRGGWVLTEYAWVLKDPLGVRVSLTSSERALLVALFDAPGLGATYEVLTAAVDLAQNLEPTTGARTRLGVLVSRLRSKCSRHDVDLPIRVMQNRGYMFAAQEEGPMPEAAPSLDSETGQRR